MQFDNEPCIDGPYEDTYFEPENNARFEALLATLEELQNYSYPDQSCSKLREQAIFVHDGPLQ